jgi:hypothetical protein
VVLVDYLESGAAITGNYHAKLIGKLCQAIKNKRRDETSTAIVTCCLIKVQCSQSLVLLQTCEFVHVYSVRQSCYSVCLVINVISAFCWL